MLKHRAVALASVAGWLLALSPTAGSALDLTAGSGAANECVGAPHFQAAAVAYFEPAPVFSIADYGGSHYAPSPGNDLAVGVGFAEVSAEVQHFCVGVLFRAEFEGTSSKDILHANHVGQTFDTGRAYEAWYEAKLFKAYGMRLRRAFELGQAGDFAFTLGLGASLLKAVRGWQQSLTGTAIATTPQYAVGTATWLRTDSDLNPADFNPFVGPGDPTGLGFSTDFELKAVSSGGTSLDVVIMDAGGRIFWRGTRNSLLMLNNSVVTYDANFNRDALVTGIDSRINETQRITTKYQVALSQPIMPRVAGLLEDDVVNGYHFVSFGTRYGSELRNVTANFDTRVHAVGLIMHWAIFSASYTANRWRPQDATAFGASLAAEVHW
jgi:hypothetical protein